ncbi:hypothetical protein B0H65DRAFT_397635, partial [Neurospora tetraspora]
DPMTGLGLTGVHNDDPNLLEEEVSFLRRAREATALGRHFTPHVFQAFFLEIIEARKRFLDFAAENLGPQDPAHHSPLAQACDRFLAVECPWVWDVASVPVQLQSEGLDYEETVEMYGLEPEMEGGDD